MSRCPPDHDVRGHETGEARLRTGTPSLGQRGPATHTCQLAFPRIFSPFVGLKSLFREVWPPGRHCQTELNTHEAKG